MATTTLEPRPFTPIFEPTGRWIRAEKNGETIIDSKRAVLSVEKPGRYYYFVPKEDVKEGILEPSPKTETTDAGTHRYWHLRLGDELFEDAVWNAGNDYPDLITIKFSLMDAWFEEDEPIRGVRNPYHRVDALKSSRHVEVLVDGTKVADSHAPVIVFETSLPPRYYLPESDIDKTYLHATDLQTHCQYKGDARYYHLTVNGNTYKNTVWYYPEPLREAPNLKGTLCFWPEKDERIELYVDGEKVA